MSGRDGTETERRFPRSLRKIGRYMGMAAVVVMFVSSPFLDVIESLAFTSDSFRAWAHTAMPYFLLAIGGVFVLATLAFALEDY